MHWIHVNYLQLETLVHLVLLVTHPTTSTATEYESVIPSDEKV